MMVHATSGCPGDTFHSEPPTWSEIYEKLRQTATVLSVGFSSVFFLFIYFQNKTHDFYVSFKGIYGLKYIVKVI